MSDNATLWAFWQHLLQVSQQNTNQHINHIFAQIKKAACKELKYSAACFARLNKNDESVYKNLSYLMGIYSHVLELGSGVKLLGPNVKVLLSGICEVLASRLKEFEDAGVKTTGANPISKEKGEIFGRISKELSNRISKVQEDIPGLETADMVYSSIFAHFTTCLRNLISELDDLPMRKMTTIYIDLLLREWEELGNIVKVQVLALESATSQWVSPADTSELPILHSILNILREAYQHTGPVVNELKNLLVSAVEQRQHLNFESFVALLPELSFMQQSGASISGTAELVPNLAKDAQSNLLNNFEELPALAQSHGNNFFNLLDDHAKALQIKNDLPMAGYQMQRTVSTEKQLAGDIVQAFIALNHSLLPEAYSQAEEAQCTILNAIKETIDIKIEILQDGILEFGREGTEFIQRFTEEKPSPNDREFSQICELVRSEWLNNPPKCEEDISAFFAVLQLEEASFSTRLNKYITSGTDGIQKLALRFKKEILLYEICTYEEVLTHSVSRLRNSPEISDTVAILDNAYSKLEILLKKNNISTIRPAPKDSFNAFEHDVLVAEQHEGFDKGQIVKALNSGYKQGDIVILRANVIAAK